MAQEKASQTPICAHTDDVTRHGALEASENYSKVVFHMATDWAPYAEEALECLNARADLENTAPDQGFVDRPNWRPMTKFENRGIKLGHGVWDLIYRKF